MRYPSPAGSQLPNKAGSSADSGKVFQVDKAKARHRSLGEPPLIAKCYSTTTGACKKDDRPKRLLKKTAKIFLRLTSCQFKAPPRQPKKPV